MHKCLPSAQDSGEWTEGSTPGQGTAWAEPKEHAILALQELILNSGGKVREHNEVGLVLWA